jgi:Holliday junction resolvase RusA-like endonuclease
LADPDGLSIKAVLDGLTKAGVFADDNAKRIKEVRFTQEQSSEEETIIEILEEA